MIVSLLVIVACNALEAPSAPSVRTVPAPSPAAARGAEGAAPPIPADNPAWQREAGPFVPEFRFYGEESWSDVRMRVAGQLAAAGRDRARLRAQAGDLRGAAEAQADLLRRLEALSVPEGSDDEAGVAPRIVTLLRGATRRDLALLEALAAGKAPPVPAGSLAAARTRTLALALRRDSGEDVASEARALAEELLGLARPRPELALDGFEDFRSRHRLRVVLVDAYLDALDPLGLEEPWGYWSAGEYRRQALLLREAARALAGESPGVPEGLEGEVPKLEGAPAVRWPSMLAEALHEADARTGFTAEGLGALPTGDTLVDTAGWPGPRAIGSLSRLGLEDPQHRARLEEVAKALNGALEQDPAQVPSRLAPFLAELEAYGHGSRYYNLKQARNEAVRVLARRGRPELARGILAGNFPLHAQDWACPNREGILRAIEGRLLAEAGDAKGAEAALQASLAAAATFLAAVDDAERRPRSQPGPGAPPPGPPPPGPPR